jgi:hypothetical protein
VLSEEVEGVAVNGGFGEPHALGLAAEAADEVGDAPADLGDAVLLVGEGQDDVVVDLGHGGAVAGEALSTEPVRVEDAAVDARGVFFKPGEEGGTEVEADAGVVVDDADDLLALVEHAAGAVGGVALGGDALVPVMEGSGGVLGLDGFEPGIFARRLVEVAVDAEVAGGGWRGQVLRIAEAVRKAK